MNQQDTELAVLASVDSLEALASLRASGVSEETFVELPHVFRFILDYAREYGGPDSIPSRELLTSQFQLSLPEKRDAKFYVEELRKRELARKAHAVLEQGIDLLVEAGKPDDAVAYMLVELARLRRQRRVTRSLTDGSALGRLDRYVEKQEALQKGLSIGLKTGLGFFDEEHVGLAPGNLLGIVGNTTVGKSWLLEYISVVAYVENNARVLFISPEMTLEEIEARWDTLAGRMFGVELSNLGLAKGRGIDTKKYKTFLERVQERKDWVTCEASDLGGAFTLSVIEDLTLQVKPNLVAVDGLPLLGIEGSSKLAQWERLAEIANGLKNLAKALGIVVIVTNQATRDAEGREELQLKNTAYSYAFVQACDQVIMISSPSDGRGNVKLVRLLKTRVGGITSRPVEIPWDVDKGRIGS